MSQLRNAILYLLLCLTIGLLVFSVSSTHLYSVSRYSLGLAGSLPVAFWVGLGSLGLLWFFGTKKNWVLASALILTIAYLFFAPAVIRDPVWLSNSYYPFGESSLINTSGHLLDRAGAPLNSYHDWPLFIYFSSVFTQLSGISVTPLLKFFPLLIISACALLTFLILKLKVTVPQALLGTGVLVASFWFRQQYFGPPGFGFVFFLLGLLIILKYFFSGRSHNITLAGLFLLVFTATAFTHFLSALILLISVAVLFLSQLLIRSKITRKAGFLFLLTTGLFLAYNLLYTPDFFFQVSDELSNLISFDSGLVQESTRIAGSAAQVFNYRSTLAIVAINCILSAVVLFSIIRSKASRDRYLHDPFTLLMIIFLVFLGVFALFFQYGPHEGYQRALMFALLPISYLCSLLISRKPKVLVLAIVFLLFLNIPSQYGADSYTLQTKTDLAGAKFIATSTPDGSVILYDFSLLQRYFEPAKNISFVVLEYLPFTFIPNSTQVLAAASACDYLIVSTTSDNYYYYFSQDTPISDTMYQTNDSSGFNRVYDSNGFIVFSK